MREVLGGFVALIGICLFVMTGSAEEIQKEKSGEAAFNQFCVVCHPGGSNIFNHGKTLHKKDMEANNIKKPEDIIKVMRNPGPQMTRFDEDTIPDNVAKEIAKYILKTFK